MSAAAARMAHILVTSGPTRQYLDPVRFLTNASSGRMGQAIASALVEAGQRVTIVTGPVQVTYPPGASVVNVVSTEEMLIECQRIFPDCDGVIGVAAPCDYRPVHRADGKIQKTGEPLWLELEETEDVIATLGRQRTRQWLVGFALETDDMRFRALTKLQRKSCALMVLNGPDAIDAKATRIEMMDAAGATVLSASGSKLDVARKIVAVIRQRLIK